MIKHEYANMFQQDSIHKDFTIAFDGGTITNEDLHQESIELSESICSENKLRFGCCESSVFKFTVSNIVTPLKNKKIKVSVVLDRLTGNALKIGEYKVVSDKPNADRNYRDIVAYDALHDVLHAEVAEWYNSLSFPMSLKQFRTAFFVYFGIEQEEITLVNDDMVIEKTIEPESISGKDVITAICEINGCFGNIGRNGKFRYVILEALSPGLYPENTLYPQNALYPRETNANTILKKHYISCEYEDFTTQKISKLQIRQEENDVGAIAGSGTNCYIVQDNFLVYGKSAEDLSDIAENLLSVISIPEYRPFNASLRGNPCMQVGELVVFSGKREMVQSYILERTLKGIQSLRDTFYADGEEENTEEINSIKSSIIQLKGKTNTLTRTVDETKSRIEDVNEGLSSQILQTADQIRLEIEDVNEGLSSQIKLNTDAIALRVTTEDFESEIEQLSYKISLKVDSGDVVNEINISDEAIELSGNRLIVNSTNFKLDECGNAEFSGTITGGSISLETETYEIKTVMTTTVFSSGNVSLSINEADEFNYVDIYGPVHVLGGGSSESFLGANTLDCSDLNAYTIYVGTEGETDGDIYCYGNIRCTTLNGYRPITSGNIDSYVSSTVPDDISVDSISGNDDYSSIVIALGSFQYVFSDVLDAFEINLAGESLGDIIADIQERLAALE